jgi:hypothetical protein
MVSEDGSKLYLLSSLRRAEARVHALRLGFVLDEIMALTIAIIALVVAVLALAAALITWLSWIHA